MGANLMWEPGKRKAYSLPDALMFILRDKRGVDCQHRTFDSSELAYLGALVDAGIEGALTLVDAIEKYGSVEVWLEY